MSKMNIDAAELEALSRTVSINLRRAREARGENIQTVARNLNIARQSLATYENGTTMPPLVYLVRFAAYYHTTIDALCGLCPPAPTMPEWTSELAMSRIADLKEAAYDDTVTITTETVKWQDAPRDCDAVAVLRTLASASDTPTPDDDLPPVKDPAPDATVDCAVIRVYDSGVAALCAPFNRYFKLYHDGIIGPDMWRAWKRVTFSITKGTDENDK